MAMFNGLPIDESLHVAPLSLGKAKASATPSNASSYAIQNANLCIQSEMTPPITPNGSQEDLSDLQMPPIFHNFLRAFYPFHPTYAMSDSTVTLPLDEGDIVLVHSIHTNGWADGTLLISGARGWLPTNYCEAYDPDEMRNLLNALLNFWDLLRSTSVNDQDIFGNQEFIKGIIAGVRSLLQRTNCLTKDSAVIQRSDVIRKCRKALMSELSALVKIAKKLQESQRTASDTLEDVNDIVDEMILKAFRIVVRGVHFADVSEEDKRSRAPPSVTVMDTVTEEDSYIPPTPPQRASYDGRDHYAQSDMISPTSEEVESPGFSPGAIQAFPLPLNQRLSSLASPPASSESRFSQSSITRLSRNSSSISHRVSLAGPAPCTRPSHLASERLNRRHDAFLSHLGSFIGRLHLQSHSRPELVSAIKRCANAGKELVAVIDCVCMTANSTNDALGRSRSVLFQRIQELVFSARETLINAVTEETDFIMPQDHNVLLASATGCVRAAGDCIAKAKASIERVGDFEFDFETGDIGIDLSVLDDPSFEAERTQSVVEQSDCASVAGSARTSASSTPATRSVTGLATDKPLPEIPKQNPPEEPEPQPSQAGTGSRPASRDGGSVSSKQSSIHSPRPPVTLPKLSTTIPPEDRRLSDNAGPEHEWNASNRFDHLVASSAGSSATYLSRESEASMVSQTSTRATTPDHSLVPRNQPSMSDMSAAASSAHTEEVDDVETRLMEKTYAHELMFNKEGQVTGGSLPALIERLTTHESAPDAIFVSSFFLTFRLFCTPIKLAEALIDRFEYVGDSPHVAGPVRLRVYNAFKQWLESHWKDSTDRGALGHIIAFAEGRLRAVIPHAGRRLTDMARKISQEKPALPRLGSSMGKTNTSIAQYVPPDAPIPQPCISKSQQGMLTAFKNGSGSPSVLDFDPLEIARQLTIKQMNIFCSIQPDELLASQWMKNGGAEARNVKAMSSLSTDLSNLVADSILQFSEIKKRAAVIKQWIKIANQCLELHNYDGLMAIICSLNSSTISRLRKTWDIISPKRKAMLRTLQKLVEPSQNNKVLRTRLHDHIPPCLPFLGMYLTDLTFVDIGNPATKQLSPGKETDDDQVVGLTVVNFDKHTRTAKIIGELQRFQIPYRLTEVPDMQEWLSDQINKVRNGDQGNVQITYYRKSLLLEPRETTPRTPIEAPATANGSRGDLFGWMSRDRGGQQSAVAQI